MLLIHKRSLFLQFISKLFIIMSELAKIQSMKSKRVFFNPAQISKHYYCCICHDVFQDPVRANCGHVYCYICIHQWSKIKVECPICKKSIGGRKLEKDYITSAVIDDFKVKCVHSGCSWISVESVRRKHQRCCPFKPKNESLPDLGSVTFVQVTDLDEINEDSEIQIVSKPEFQ